MDMMHVTLVSLPNLTALVAISKGMQAVLQQNLPLLNWGCWLIQVVLCCDFQVSLENYCLLR